MTLIMPRRMPSKDWIGNAINNEFSQYGWGPVAMIVDDTADDVVVVIKLPKQISREGAIAGSKFYISAQNAASRDELEILIRKTAKKAARLLAKQIHAEKARPLNG